MTSCTRARSTSRTRARRCSSTRVAMVEKMVAELLAKPMNHDDEEYDRARSEEGRAAATEDELRERWRRARARGAGARRHDGGAAQSRGRRPRRTEGKAKADDEASRRPLAADRDDPDDARGPRGEGAHGSREDVRGAVRAPREPGQLDAAADLINAVAATLDPHTDYLPPADKANFDIADERLARGHRRGAAREGRLHRGRRARARRRSVAPGRARSPAISILGGRSNEGKDPVDIVNMRIDEVVKMIRGPKGTVVALRVQKADGDEETIVDHARRRRDRGDVRARRLLQKKGAPTIGYIHLPSFYGTASAASARLRRRRSCSAR